MAKIVKTFRVEPDSWDIFLARVKEHNGKINAVLENMIANYGAAVSNPTPKADAKPVPRKATPPQTHAPSTASLVSVPYAKDCERGAMQKTQAKATKWGVGKRG